LLIIISMVQGETPTYKIATEDSSQKSKQMV
jgi:hypothetical protein